MEESARFDGLTGGKNINNVLEVTQLKRWRSLEWVSSSSRSYHYPAEGPAGDYSLLPRPRAVEAR